MGNDNPHKEINEPVDGNTKSDSSQKLMDDLMGAIMSNATKPATNEVTDLGQISCMELPSGWEKGADEEKRQHSATYHEYHPEGDPSCQLGFYYRGRRTSENAGHNFHEVLNKPVHSLSRSEFDSLKETIRDKFNSTDFHATNARTVDINGKRVLLLEGRYNEIQQDAKHIFVDADGTGTAVQEIFFQAPKDKFANYAKTAERAMKSIRWK